MALRISILLIVGFTLFSCGGNPPATEVVDTPSSGEITVTCDESLKPIIEAEEMVFEQLYAGAKINMVYTNEHDAIQLVLKDSARMAIVTREFNSEELAALKDQQISHVNYHKLGYDAIGLILNPANHDTSFTLKQVYGLLSGEISDWSQINPKNSLGKIQVVFDDPKSGAIRQFQDSVLKGVALGKNCFALKSNPDVISYVQKNKSAVGIIGVSWISDTDDVQSKGFLQNIKVAEVEPILMRLAGITNKPIQGNIALKQYPYWRMVRVASREMRAGLGTGFASFMESDPGQKIFLKGGLVPYRSSIRTINLN